MSRNRGSIVAQRQEPLRRRYSKRPLDAWIRDHARAVIGNGPDPFHGEIEPTNNSGTRRAYGIHRAVGGDHDAPDPGDLLSAALAACLHSTTRMQAERLDVELIDIEVSVTAEADVRGCLMVARSVPVGFQRMHCEVRLEVPGGTPARRLRTLMTSAERACVVMQTLSRGIDVHADWRIEQESRDRGADNPRSNPTNYAEVPQ